jgi:NAD(P)-dependent dehydrogenase (short-subunit alcohol dehydrogenase family)
MVILCGNTTVPSSSSRHPTVDGLDEEWQVNYLANFHLLSILSPALRMQPPHRDVRVIFTTCSSYIGAKLDMRQIEAASIPTNNGKKTGARSKKTRVGLYGASKLALMSFAHSFQKHLNAFERPDKMPPCTRVVVVDPGYSRTPGTRRWLTGGSLWGLLLYLITWPLWWLVLKSPQQGAQSILYAAMEAKYGRGDGGWMVKECQEVDFARKDIKDEEAGKLLWQFSEKQIELKEKESAVKRALANKEQQEKENQKNSGPSTSWPKEQTPGSRRSRKGNK